MKTNVCLLASALLTMVMVVSGCRKTISNAENQILYRIKTDSFIVAIDSPVLPIVPFPQSPFTGCTNDPNYGDSILYPQPAIGQDDFVGPLNNPGPGRYLSWPAGMTIDSVTGAIDLTSTEAGQKYVIGFVSAGTTDTCLSTLIVGGASYMDSIYDISQGSGYASPYFDADPSLVSICGTLPNGSARCSFDITGSATNHRMVIDKSTGVIDLKKSLNGIFGGHPSNGQSALITIYYQLNDASNMALQHIQVEVLYYDSRTAMNLGLVGKINGRHAQEAAGQLVSPNSAVRPPLVVIVRHN